MITFPNAKINLGLIVGDTRPDGYHNLETVFYPLYRLCDVLEIVPAQTDSFELFGLPVAGENKDNLVMRVVRLMRENFSIPPLAIALHKKIPMGAGMGGGSADAAFALRMINEMFELGLSNAEMKLLIRSLGADCPFFIDNVPSIAYGIGDELSPIDINLSDYHILVVKPPVFVSTPEAYRGVRPLVGVLPVKDAVALPIEQWKDCLFNSFESNVFEKFEELRRIKADLYAEGATYALMSGSGSALFGLFKCQRDDLVEHYRQKGYFSTWG
ncbi:MAG: 4-(cytidine 5'-diphospho)-2-C-methyl-D-erythritol kinase [Bacteroidales bacterium]|nr:4-(cytidine 5'-diphospho)-2-C-methyl-D-erythritol kinase [Bacteroidales bacterium]